jgi:hypothetical protein
LLRKGVGTSRQADILGYRPKRGFALYRAFEEHLEEGFLYIEQKVGRKKNFEDYMQALILILIVLVFLIWKPELLHSFDNTSGRILMLLAVVFLIRLNVLLGFVAALVMIRVIDRDTRGPVLWKPSASMIDLEGLMRPKDSDLFPTLRTTTVPLNDIYEQYTVYG